MGRNCRFLAVGIANIITLLAPESVIIGGGVRRRAIYIHAASPIASAFVSMIPADKINILPAELGGESGVCGALVWRKKRIQKLMQSKKINVQRGAI